MFGLSRIWSALAALASNITALASTVAEANGNLRSQLHLDGPDQELQEAAPLLPNRAELDPTAAPERNGRSRKQTAAAE